MRSRRLSQVLAALTTAVLLVSLNPASAASGDALPTRTAGEATADYIVVFNAGVNPRAQAALLGQAGAAVSHVYENVFSGLAASLTDRQARALSRSPLVRIFERDGIASISETQSGATWGLDRIDQAARPLSGTFTYAKTGVGVTAYVIDTGILASHTQFGGRASGGVNTTGDRRGTTDCNGHGTHVAGTIGGSTFGVAKAVSLVPVRVLGCNGSGTWSGVIAGIDWVTANKVLPAVANLSLGGGRSSSVDTAVANLVNAGVTVAVAAGNSTADACSSSPAAEPTALTVGATASNDARASYSNYGTCVDLFAPGSSITSAWHTSTTAINTISGTSMASPHVAGIAALALAENSTLTPAQVTSVVTGAATPGVVTDVLGSPNLLSYANPLGVIGAPRITSFTPTSASVSATVTITGANFSGATAVSIGGAAAGSFTVNSSTQITATVAAGASTGVVSVTTPWGSGSSSAVFTPSGSVSSSPTITSFTPSSGPIGTLVTITGTNLSTATALAIGGAQAESFTVVSATQITATVGAGAVTGVVSVTTSGGSASSSAMFTVTVPSVTTPPGAPTSLFAAPVNKTSATLSWTPGSGSVDSYTIFVYVGTSTTPSGQIPDVSGGATVVTIRGLKTKTSYTFRMQAFNTGGASPMSEPSNTITTP